MAWSWDPTKPIKDKVNGAVSWVDDHTLDLDNSNQPDKDKLSGTFTPKSATKSKAKKKDGNGFFDKIHAMTMEIKANKAEAKRGEMIVANLAAQLNKMLMPAPNLADYVKPFGDARNLANQTHDAGVPVINGAFADLASKLQAAQSQQGVRTGQLQADAANTNATLASQFAQTNAASLNDVAANGGVPAALNPVQQQASLQQALLGQNAGKEQQNLANRLQMAQQSMGDRISEGDLAKAAALTNSQSQLQQALQQIGMGEAQAKQQYGQDAASVARGNAGISNDFWAQKTAEKAEMTKAAAAQAEAEAHKLEQLKIPAQQNFLENKFQSYQQSNPNEAQVFMDIVENAGGGALGKYKALAVLNSSADAIRNGQYTNKNEDSLPQADPDAIADWLNQYYSTEKVLPDGIFDGGGF